MAVLFSNYAYSTLATAIDDSQTSLTVAAGHGARFPSPTGVDYFYATLESALLVREIVKVTARSTDTLTIVRAQDNTTAQAFSAGVSVALRINAAALSDLIVALQASVTASENLYVPLIVFSGESNSGGYAVNADLSAPQLAARPAVSIWNNTTDVFEPLDIGTNNLIDHTGLTANATHGWENGLATSVEANECGYSSVYLVKTGQGGSIISEWSVTGDYFITLALRLDAAIAAIKATGKTPLIYMWYSQGINDAIAATATATWITASKAHFSQLRNRYGFFPIISPEFPPTYTTYNAALQDLRNQVVWFYVVPSSGAALRDTNHWDSDGMALLASRMAAVTCTTIGATASAYNLSASFALSQFSSGTTPIEAYPTGNVVWTATQNATASASTGALTNNGSLSSGAMDADFIDATQAFSYEWTVGVGQETVIVILDSDSDASFGWNTGVTQTFLSGFYANVSNTMYYTTGRLSFSYVGVSPAYPCKIRALKSGDDLLYQTSADLGVTWSTVYTDTNVLAGQTLLRLKVIFATADASKSVSIRKST